MHARKDDLTFAVINSLIMAALGIDHLCELLLLPLELREQIFQYCLEEGVQSQRSIPNEPALSLVSKQLRSEVLPIYYSQYTLPVQIYIRCSYHGQVWLKTEAWYHNLTAAKLRHVQHFELHFALIDRYTGERIPIHVAIDLHARSNRFTIRSSLARSWVLNPHRLGDPADFAELILVLEQHVSRTLDDIVLERETLSLTAECLDFLWKIDPDSLPLQTAGRTATGSTGAEE